MSAINPYVILAAIAALLVSFIGGGVIGWHEKSIRVPALLESQQTTDQKACEKTQQLTKDANDALQKDHDSVTAELNALRLRKPSACVRPSAKAQPANGGEAGHAASNVSSDWLLSFAATCETYRRAIITVDQFLDAERANEPAP